MRILLVQSPAGRKEEPVYPLGLAFLAGQLPEHSVSAVDLSLFNNPVEVLHERIRTFTPDIIAISLRNIDDSSYPVTHSYVCPFSEIIQSLDGKAGIVVVGGTGFSIYPEIILRDFPRIDYGLPGEGEVILPMLIDHIEKGLVIEEWDRSRMLPWIKSDLSAIRLPAYGIINISDYDKNWGIGVQTRRGCSFSCSYCTYGYLGGKSFRTRPVEHVISDIRNLKEMGVRHFQFVDSVFNVPHEYFRKLLLALKEINSGMKWSAWLTEDVSEDDIALMAGSGAVKVDFSPDAITDTGLQLLGKHNSASDLLPAVIKAKKAGLTVGVNFFNGNPGEGFAAMLRKLKFLLMTRFTLGWKNTFVNIGTIRVYAHSIISRQMIECGLVDKNCDFFAPVFYRNKGPSDWLFRFFQLLRRIRRRIREHGLSNKSEPQ